jgi:hypothetical protein
MTLSPVLFRVRRRLRRLSEAPRDTGADRRDSE